MSITVKVLKAISPAFPKPVILGFRRVLFLNDMRLMKRKSDELVKKGKELNYAVELKCKKKWIGVLDAGFYVCTEYLPSNPVVYSIGVGEDITFDLALIAKYNAKIFAFDPTPRAIRFVEKMNPGANFIFRAVGLMNFDGMADFYLPVSDTLVSGSIINFWSDSKEVKEEKVSLPFERFSTMVQKSNIKAMDILKIDIEGAEYDVMDEILSSGIEIKQILIEFHHRYIENGFELTKDCIEKIQKAGYKIAAISPSKLEYTFLKA